MGPRASKTLAVVAILVALVALFAWLGADPRESEASLSAMNNERVTQEFAAATKTMDSGLAVPAAAPEPTPLGAAQVNTKPTTNATLTVRVHWAATGAPAVDMPLALLAWDVPRRPLAPRIEGRTDDGGVWRLEPAPLGKVTVYALLGGRAKTTVTENVDAVLEILLEPGLRVDGVAFDPQGRPAADAEIWVSDYGNTTYGAVVTRTESAGTFHLPSVPAGHYIGARSEHDGPSRLEFVPTGSTRELFLELHLQSGGGAVRGLVVNKDKLPIPDVEVVAMEEQGWPYELQPDGRNLLGPPALRTRSDANGEFAFEHVPPSMVTLSARAEGLSPAREVVSVKTGETAQARLVLPPAASLRGRVTDGAGLPVAGAHVQVGEHGLLVSAGGKTDGDGRYELREIPIGTGLRVSASKDHVGSVREELTIAPGRQHEWNPVLRQGRVIKGQVVDEYGAPVPGAWLSAAEAGDNEYRSAETDEQGRFTLANLVPGLHRIEVRESDEYFDRPPVLVLEGVEPAGEPLVIVLGSDLRATAWLLGRVLTAAGPPPRGAQVWLTRPGSNTSSVWAVDEASGVFEWGPLPPGTFAFSVHASGFPETLPQELILAPYERRDLGLIELDAAGRLIVHLRGEADSTVKGARLDVESPDGTRDTLMTKDGVATSLPLAAGAYALLVDGQGIVAQRLPFEIVSGLPTQLDVEVRSGVALHFRLLVADGDEETQAVKARLFDAVGTLLSERSVERENLLASSTRWWGDGVLPGAHRLEVRRTLPADDRLLLETTFVVTEPKSFSFALAGKP